MGFEAQDWQRLATEIRLRRHRLGWTQRELATRASVSHAALRLAEAATVHPRIPGSVVQICEALGWPATEVVEFLDEGERAERVVDLIDEVAALDAGLAARLTAALTRVVD